MKPICQHKKNKDMYRYEGDNKFTNMRTNQSGEVSDELANKIFIFCPEVSETIKDYPIVEEMISRLQLKLA